MNRPTRLVAAVGAAAMLLVGVGAGSASAATSGTKGVFTYHHNSDQQKRAMYDPKADRCLDMHETGVDAYNGTDTTVTLNKGPSCSGVDEDTLVLKAGAKDTSGFTFKTIKFGAVDDDDE